MNKITHYLDVLDKYVIFGDITALFVIEVFLSVLVGLVVFKKIFGFIGSLFSRRRPRNVKLKSKIVKKSEIKKNKTPKEPGRFQIIFANLIKDISGYQDTEKEHVPSRVLDDIKINQDASELYVAGLQLVIIFILGFAYFYTLPERENLSLLTPVTISLGLYALFSGARLVLAFFKRLGLLLLTLSIIVDFSILTFVIFSLRHENIGTAPLFYFSFILIALRTMRFQPVWVFMSGFCAFSSCAILAVTSDQVYIVDEMSKLLSILVVTIVLMISQFMAKQTSYKAARSESAVTDLSHFFDQDVVQKIIAQEEGPDLTIAERRTATIMFVDLRGFTLLSREQTPNKTISLIKDYQNLIVPIIRKHHGSIDKFMGDGILASFGAVQEQETFARSALEAAKEALEAFNKWRGHQLLVNSPAPHIGMGIASGEIIYGIIGDEVRYEYTVMGDAVNFAAKLEKHTKVQEVPVLCDDETVQLARKQGSEIKMECFESVRIEGVPGYKVVWTVDTKKEAPKGVYFK